MDDPRATIHSLVRRSAHKPVFGQPVKAAPAHVAAAMRPEEAFRVTLSDCLAQITANAAAVRVGRSVEGLHQLRVAFRRLNVALGAFGREFRQDWLEELRGRARILSGRLAPARDLDVFIDELLATAPRAARGEGLTQLRGSAEGARDVAWQAAATCVTGADFEIFVDDVAALAGSQLPLTRQRRLPKTAARMLNRQMAGVKKRGRAARSRDEGDLHRLRIALKKLRYTAEFFAPLYPVRDVKRYLKKLRALQARLGALNDAANIRSLVAALLRDDGKARKESSALGFAAGALVGWADARNPSATIAALKRYRNFCRVAPFWR